MVANGETLSARLQRNWNYFLAICPVVLVLAVPVFAAGSGLERIGPIVGATADITQAVEEKGYRVTLDDGWSAEFWFARALSTAAKESAGALFPALSNGEFVAVVSFPKGTTDYRGQAIPPGNYTLRYQYLPQDANHMGVSPNPDFLLAVPLDVDLDPDEPLPYKKLVSLSAKSTGTAHPAVIAMASSGAPATVVKDEQGMTVMTVEVPSATAGKTQTLGIVLKGQATQ